MKLRTKVILAEHHAAMSAMRLAARMGFKKYKTLIEGPSNDMTNDQATRAFMWLYGKAERKAVRKWMESGRGKSYLDVGAGQGRFSAMAMETGASRVTALDINENCIAMLKKKGFDVRNMDARDLGEFSDNSFDRTMIFGNTLAGMYEGWHGGEKSFQVEILREMLRVAKEEVAITLQRPDSLLFMLQYYRMNGLEVYGYDDESGIKRIKMRKPGETLEFRSQHFRKEQIEKLLKEVGVSEGQYEIKPINMLNWMVVIRK